MSGIATAIVGGAVISGIASNSAGNTQANAANNASKLSQAQYQQNRSDQLPFMQAGYGAQSKLNNLLGISPQTNTGAGAGGAQPLSYQDWASQNSGSQFGIGANGSIMPRFGVQPTQAGYQQYLGGFPSSGAGASGTSGQSSDFGSLLAPFTAQQFNQYQDPGYQFQLQQGTQGLQNSAAAGSGALSGAALKDLIGYNQDMASTAYSNAFNRYQTQQGNIFTRLSSIANQGENAAANTGAQGTALAGQSSNAIQAAGAAQAAGTVGIANSLNTGVQNYAGGKYLGLF